MKKPRLISAAQVNNVTDIAGDTEASLNELVSALSNGQAIESESIPNLLNMIGDLARLASIASDAANKLTLRIGYINNRAEMDKLRAEKLK